MPSEINWSQFVVRVNINNVAIEKLYWCWATRAGMEHWFLRTCEYKTADGVVKKDKDQVCTGDSYKWHWHGYGDDSVEYGTILDCNNKDHLKFSFGKAGNCAIEILKEDDQTIVQLTQGDIPNDDLSRMNYHVGCKSGWTFHLANMKSILEGGIDLRNKNIKIKNMLNS
ncbi:MAG: SRPBCC domain-containing protein [Chitinophagaceae bacterium]|nr:SRPBCC domain-containing protein [Chitinophagaceae bacterium]